MDSISNKAEFDCYDRIISREIRTDACQEAVVPDTMPDAAEIVEASALLMLRSKDVQSGKAELEASAAVSVVYKPEGEGKICSLELSVPVSICVEDERIDTDMLFSAYLKVSGLEARLLNPRKLNIKAEICGKCEIFAAARFSLGGCDAEIQAVHYKTESAELTPIVSVKEKTFVITDEFVLPPSRADAGEILARRTDISVDEVRPLGKKLIFKGSVRCCILYCSRDGLVASVEFTTGFSQIMENEAESDEQLAELAVMLTGAYFEILPSGDGRTISAELHMVAQCTARTVCRAEYVSDAYSNVHPLSVERLAKNEDCLRRREKLQAIVIESLDLQFPGSEIIDSFALTGTPEIDGGRVRLPVTAVLLYQGGDGEMHMMRKRCVAELKTELGADEYLQVSSVEAADILTAPSGSGTELRIRLAINVLELAKLSLSVVSTVNCDMEKTMSLADKPSLVLALADENSSIWELARENCSSPEAIAAVNDFEGFGENWRRLILIPKTK